MKYTEGKFIVLPIANSLVTVLFKIFFSITVPTYVIITFCFYHYIWIHLNPNREQAKTIQNLKNEHVVL